ncbi:BrnA antitoxin family protein [Acidithiobacillus ferrianus]|uniref:Cytoplasmic protein n=2 Tax=Acidithiobacillus ferrianus TaxID=2678518 RepID=A0A845U7Z2_9PROT|nr:BrnA antitoxin family protein [Acidithiobacillus ferrianus]NDU41877.1 cytoplasmic protein [Acidithiobacillus ferrianus]
MNNRTVEYELDMGNLPPLTKNQKAELEALMKPSSDEEIDYSDIPALDDDFWKAAVRNPFYKPKKASTTVRVDVDVLLWLRSKGKEGKGYQTRINAILREAMLKDVSRK